MKNDRLIEPLEFVSNFRELKLLINELKESLAEINANASILVSIESILQEKLLEN